MYVKSNLFIFTKVLQKVIHFYLGLDNSSYLNIFIKKALRVIRKGLLANAWWDVWLPATLHHSNNQRLNLPFTNSCRNHQFTNWPLLIIRKRLYKIINFHKTYIHIYGLAKKQQQFWICHRGSSPLASLCLTNSFSWGVSRDTASMQWRRQILRASSQSTSRLLVGWCSQLKKYEWRTPLPSLYDEWRTPEE